MNKKVYKYFEFSDPSPFYSLIKAKDANEAVIIYNEEVMGEPVESGMYHFIEIGKNTVLGKYANYIGSEERKDYKLSDLIRDFENPNNYILLLDGSLN